MLLFCGRQKPDFDEEGIIRSRFIRLGALCIGIFCGEASALGLGEIVLHSRVGEPLRAEIPVLASEGEAISTACFSLVPVRGSDLPVVTSARTRLTGNGENLRIIIVGEHPIAEPLFMISVRASCGIALQRDYVLMPPAPVVQATAVIQAPSAISPAKPRSGRFQEWQASDGETLESIAAAQLPDDMPAQRRLLAALRRANPEFLPDQALSEGTPVLVPNRSQRLPAERMPAVAQTTSLPPDRPGKSASAAPKPVRRDTLSGLAGKGADRVTLGPEPEPLNPGEQAMARRGDMQEMDERMLKLETSLRSLSLQVDNLNSALAVSAETIAMRQKLQAAQAQQRAASAPFTVNAAPAVTAPAIDSTSPENWIELFFSALAGGLMVAGIAHYLNQRGRSTRQPWMESTRKVAKGKPRRPSKGATRSPAGKRPDARR